MYRKFSEQPSDARRGQQIWQILVGAAMRRQTMTYGQLGVLIGWKGMSGIGGPLGHIANYCGANDLPILSIIVVRQDTGEPGNGLDRIKDQDEAREAVFNFDWYDVEPPTVDQMIETYAAASVYTP